MIFLEGRLRYSCYCLMKAGGLLAGDAIGEGCNCDIVGQLRITVTNSILQYLPGPPLCGHWWGDYASSEGEIFPA